MHSADGVDVTSSWVTGAPKNASTPSPQELGDGTAVAAYRLADALMRTRNDLLPLLRIKLFR